MRLIIAIPTFNRAGKLSDRLQELIPQLTPEVAIHVFDNASTDHTEQVVAECNHPSLRYSRSTGNLGMCGNFIRCFVTPESDWLWILGDDDPVQPDALSRILQLIQKTPANIVSFNTNCNHNARNEVVAGLARLFEIKDTTSLMHISSNLYRISRLRESFKVLTPSAFTFAPNVAIIFHALQADPNCSIELSTEEFLYDGKNPRRWSCMEVSVGLSLFPCYIMDAVLQRECALKLRISTRWMLLWALGEIQPGKQQMKHWRRTVRQANGNFSSFGAGFFPMLSFCVKYARPDFRREILIQLIARLPQPLFQLLCAKMKKKTEQRRAVLTTDFS